MSSLQKIDFFSVLFQDRSRGSHPSLSYKYRALEKIKTGLEISQDVTNQQEPLALHLFNQATKFSGISI